MKKIFLDTNILLDVIEGRPKFLVASSNVLDFAIRKKIQLFATSLTFANCAYIARKNVGYENAIKGLIALKKLITIAPMDDQQCEKALHSVAPDFEDMLQYMAAQAAECEIIITRDYNRHFPTDGIPIMSPESFLETFAKE